MQQEQTTPKPNAIAKLIFASRWVQLPIYLGLIVVQIIYAFKFLKSLWHLVVNLNQMDENTIMLAVLNLIDVVMIANLLVMVLVFCYRFLIVFLVKRYFKKDLHFQSQITTELRCYFCHKRHQKDLMRKTN